MPAAMNDYAIRHGAIPDIMLRTYANSGLTVQCLLCGVLYDIHQPPPHQNKDVVKAKRLWLELELRRHHRADMKHPDAIEFPSMFYSPK